MKVAPCWSFPRFVISNARAGDVAPDQCAETLMVHRSLQILLLQSLQILLLQILIRSIIKKAANEKCISLNIFAQTQISQDL